MSNENKSNATEPITLGPAALARLRKGRRDRLRLDEAWQQVKNFLPGDEAEEGIKQFLTSLLSSVEEWCNPGEAGEVCDFELVPENLEYYHWLFDFENSRLPLELLGALLAEED